MQKITTLLFSILLISSTANSCYGSDLKEDFTINSVSAGGLSLDSILELDGSSDEGSEGAQTPSSAPVTDAPEVPHTNEELPQNSDFKWPCITPDLTPEAAYTTFEPLDLEKRAAFCDALIRNGYSTHVDHIQECLKWDLRVFKIQVSSNMRAYEEGTVYNYEPLREIHPVVATEVAILLYNSSNQKALDNFLENLKKVGKDVLIGDIKDRLSNPDTPWPNRPPAKV